MKKVFLFILASSFCLSLSAQFRRNNTVSYDDGLSTRDVYTSFCFSWHPVVLSVSGLDNYTPIPVNGISLYGSRIRSVLPSLPNLLVEYGLGFEYAFADFPEDARNQNDRIYGEMLSLRVPLNVMYRFDIPSAQITVFPYTGFEPYAVLRDKYCFYYKDEGKRSLDPSSWSEYLHFYDQNGEYKSSRVHLDWKFGVRVLWRQFFFSSSYQVGLTRYKLDGFSARISQAALSVGVMF